MASRPRPLSPHLQVYRPQWTSVLSITHRATGVALSVGLLLLAYWVISAAAGPEAYDTAQGFLGSFFGRLILFGFTFALFYHLGNGIRHLVWDSGKWLDLDMAYKSGIAVVAFAVLATLLSWIIGYIAL